MLSANGLFLPNDEKRIQLNRRNSATAMHQKVMLLSRADSSGGDAP